MKTPSLHLSLFAVSTLALAGCFGPPAVLQLSVRRMVEETALDPKAAAQVPFVLKFGMSEAEIRQIVPVQSSPKAPWALMVKSSAVPHPVFRSMVLLVSSQHGLCSIMTEPGQMTSGHPSESYEVLTNLLTQRYGIPSQYDSYEHGGSLLLGRGRNSRWERGSLTFLPDGVERVEVTSAAAPGGSRESISVSLTGTNFSSCMKSVEKEMKRQLSR